MRRLLLVVIVLAACKADPAPEARQPGSPAPARPASKPVPPACADLVPPAELAKLTQARLQTAQLPVALPDSGRWAKTICQSSDYAFSVTVMCSGSGDALFNGELDVIERSLGARPVSGLGRRALAGKIGSASLDGVWIWDDDAPCIVSVSGEKDVEPMARLIIGSLSPATVK